jgi:hypothetical protein
MEEHNQFAYGTDVANCCENIITVLELVIGFIEHLQNVTTNNYNSLTELLTPNITVTTAHISLLSLISAVVA